MSSKHEVPDRYTGGGCAMKAFASLQQENARLKELNWEMVEAMEMVVKYYSEVHWTLPISVVLWMKTILAKAWEVGE